MSSPTKEVVMLVANVTQPPNLQMQSQVRNIFTARNVTYEEIDGSSDDKHELRDKLFGISGLKGDYPQIFFRTPDGGYTFVGNGASVCSLDEASKMVKDMPAILEQNPALKSQLFEEVFADVLPK
eukprot:CAMPEP_0179104488 /NCGR_PEP_ID=MMETSP0796-20121207/48472_1 /TAXON_ID=73915 /ORGANISM="Pyrodinium bahamense, Strain pbaha01" /LENGTH=124 /DNA_ID=CAMNT_0020802433 /DNA_START=60 /DNA_END=434 /DNA_ORIENTATION=-